MLVEQALPPVDDTIVFRSTSVVLPGWNAMPDPRPVMVTFASVSVGPELGTMPPPKRAEFPLTVLFHMVALPTSRPPPTVTFGEKRLKLASATLPLTVLPAMVRSRAAMPPPSETVLDPEAKAVLSEM